MRSPLPDEENFSPTIIKNRKDMADMGKIIGGWL
jgi:hypothetical protein